MAGLQRSSISFRRQGSSGLIWDDNIFSAELQRFSDGKPPQSAGDQIPTAGNNQSDCSDTKIRSVNTVLRNRSRNGGASPATEPPSPRVPVCGLCRGFRKLNETRRRRDSRKSNFT